MTVQQYEIRREAKALLLASILHETRVRRQYQREPNRRPVKCIDGALQYRCTECFELKPVNQFYRLSNPASRSGRNSWCKSCCNKRRVLARRAAREVGVA